MEREFRIHLDSHVQTLVVVGVEHVGKFRVRCERVHENGCPVEPEYLCRIGGPLVKSLQVLHVVVGGEVRFERACTAQVQAHVAEVARVVTRFGAQLVVAEPVDLCKACVVVIDGFLVVDHGHVRVTHAFGTEGVVRRGLGGEAEPDQACQTD